MSMISALKAVYKKSQLLDEQVEKAVKYLRFYEYIKDEFTLDDFANAVVRLQRQADIHVNGELSPKTLRVMDLPRCGCKEYMEEANQLNRWGLEVVNVFIESRDSDLSAKLWDEAVIKALEGVERVCGLRFKLVFSYDQANIVLGVGRGRKDDFDGPSGTLGWCYLPQGSNFRGRINSMLDEDETWVYPSGRGIRVLNVISHEIGGHGCGLSHTDVPGSLMNPFYNPDIAYPTAAWDIPQLVKRYGPPKQSPVDPKPEPPTETPSAEEMIIKLNSDGVPGKIEIPGFRVSRIG